jgi:hypothetical protein
MSSLDMFHDFGEFHNVATEAMRDEKRRFIGPGLHQHERGGRCIGALIQHSGLSLPLRWCRHSTNGFSAPFPNDNLRSATWL